MLTRDDVRGVYALPPTPCLSGAYVESPTLDGTIYQSSRGYADGHAQKDCGRVPLPRTEVPRNRAHGPAGKRRTAY